MLAKVSALQALQRLAQLRIILINRDALRESRNEMGHMDQGNSLLCSYAMVLCLAMDA